MSTTKRLLALVVMMALLSSIFVTAIPLSASAYDNSNTYTITGFDTTPPSSTHSSIYVYPNTGSTTRVINASDYVLRYSKLMIFNASGKLIEAGENIYPNSDTVTGSPQLTVNVPAGGFMVAFGANATGLVNCYNTAMEGAMLYNATMSVIYEVYGSYNKSTNKLTIQYNNPTAPSANAKKFMVVGNSTTYFNGIPIKFKGIAQAAGIELDVTYCTKGSSYLYQYADATTDCGTQFRNLLSQKSFDYVVLQDAGKAVYSQSKPAMDTLMPLITANGAKAVLYKRYASETDPDERLAHAKIHHENYTQLAEDFNIDMVAPVADAFLISDLKYPEINLYADDNSHHSKEGSYLAALVWAITYLGIDITDNTYTADLPADTVDALKECAKIACEVGYFDAPIISAYDNLTSGNSYTISAEPPTGAPDTDNKELTDGIVATDLDMTSPYYSDARWVGLSFTNTLREVEVVMPLGNGQNVSELYKVTVNAGTSLVGGGCHEPSFTVYYSIDGVNYHEFGTHTSTDAATNIAMNFSVSSDIPVRATHIKLVFTPYTGNVCRISEISAFGYKTNLTNVTAGNTYTISVAPPSGVEADDTNGKELTDGEIVRGCDIRNSKYNDDRWVGLSFSSTLRSVDVVMPVGDGNTPVKLSEVTVNFGTDAIGAGVTEPNIIVYASSDGVTYKEFGRYERDATTTKYALNVAIEGIPVMATHIKVNFTLIDGRNVCRVGEIAAYGYKPVVENVSAGSSYTMSATPASSTPDPDLTKLTDGIVPTNSDIASPYYSDSRWVGLGFNNSTIREVEVILTLDSVCEFHEVAFTFGGEKIGSGVTEPNADIYYSEDGTTYKEFGSYTRTGDTSNYVMEAVVTSDESVKGKYVKLVFTLPDGTNTCRIAEISVFGIKPIHENISEGTSYTISATPPSGAPDPDFSKLTDSIIPTNDDVVSPYYNDDRWVGMGFSSTVRTVDVILTLDGICEFSEVIINFGGEKIGAGVTEPNADIFYSEDGVTYKEFGSYKRTGDTTNYVMNGVVSSDTSVKANYVKISFALDDNKTTCRIGEISVFGKPHEHALAEDVWKTDDDSHWKECTCGKKYNLASHKGEWKTIEEAGLHKEGTKELRCTVCDKLMDTETVPQSHEHSTEWSTDESGHWHECSCGDRADFASHDDGEWKTVEEAGLHKDGTKELQCTVCGYVLDSETIPQTHNYSAEWSTDASGHWHECSCGDRADFASHDDGEWKTVEEAGLHKEGTKELQCTVCGYVLDSETIPQTHNYSTEWSSDENNHWHECSCGDRADIDAHTNVKWVVTEEAGYHKEGKQEFRCLDCGYVFDTDIVSAEHKFDSEWFSDEIGHWKTCECGEASDTIKAHDDGEWKTIEEAGLHKEGTKELQCTVCGYVLDSETIPQTHNHSTEWSSDEVEHWHECSCGDMADKAPHTNVKWVVTEEAEYHKEGKQEFRCMDCGYVFDTDVVPAEHIYDSKWKSDEFGHWKHCACGEKSNDIQSHDKGEWITVKDATENEEGMKELRCTVCGHVMETEAIPVISSGMIGDINDNGEIDSMDYILLKRAYFGTYKLSDELFKRGDINDNGEIDSMDYVLLKRMYFGTYVIK